MTTEVVEVKAEVIEPDALAKIPEPKVTYTLPTVDVGSMEAIDKDIGNLRKFCEGIDIDPSSKEQVKSLRDFCTDINKAAGVFDAKRKGMEKDIKAASSSASTALNERRDALLEIRSALLPKLDEADRLFVEGRKRALSDEYEACAPDLMELIPLDTYIERNPKLVGRTWKDRTAVNAFGAMVIEAIDARTQIEAANLEFSSDADRKFCETLDLASALAENARLVAEKKAREAHEDAARRLAAEIESRKASFTVANSAERVHPAEPSVEARSPEPVKDWMFPFSGTRSQAESIAKFARSLGVTSTGIVPVRKEA